MKLKAVHIAKEISMTTSLPRSCDKKHRNLSPQERNVKWCQIWKDDVKQSKAALIGVKWCQGSLQPSEWEKSLIKLAILLISEKPSENFTLLDTLINFDIT